MKAMIFGANGQDGFYLSELCKIKGIETITVSRSGAHLHADVANYNDVERLIKRHLPDYVFHLAANSTTDHNALFENHKTISTGTLNILEIVKRNNPSTKIFITGSGVQFENNGEPISEHNNFEANSPYSVARIHSVYAARYYRSLGIKTYVGYLFHHESPLRKPKHVSQIIVQLANSVAKGSKEIIDLGNISVQKEWTFAGDIVKGIFTLVEQDDVFEATIGSGITYSIKDWLELCFAIVGKSWKDHVLICKEFKTEYHKLFSNPATINSLGWKPEMSLEQTAMLMINN